MFLAVVVSVDPWVTFLGLVVVRSLGVLVVDLIVDPVASKVVVRLLGVLVVGLLGVLVDCVTSKVVVR